MSFRDDALRVAGVFTSTPQQAEPPNFLLADYLIETLGTNWIVAVVKCLPEILLPPLPVIGKNLTGVFRARVRILASHPICLFFYNGSGSWFKQVGCLTHRHSPYDDSATNL